MNISLSRPKIATFDRIIEQAENAVAVVVVILGGVDAALRRDTVRPPRRVLEAKTFNVIPELAQGRRRGSACETASDDDNIKF